MSLFECLKLAKNRVSFVCLRAGDLRKNKSIIQLSQKDAFKQANDEFIILLRRF